MTKLSRMLPYIAPIIRSVQMKSHASIVGRMVLRVPMTQEVMNVIVMNLTDIFDFDIVLDSMMNTEAYS